MLKKLSMFCFLLVVCLSYSYVLHAEGLIYYQDDTATYPRLIPVTPITKLPVDADITIATITTQTNITPITGWATQTLTLVANTAQSITTTLTTANRRFIELKSHDATDVFWIDFGAVAVIGASRPCDGYFYGEVPIGVIVSVIASTAYDIAVTEGGDD